MKYFLCLFLAIGIISCNLSKKDDKTLFEQQLPSATGVDFRNDLTFSNDFNIFTYRNFYNGGGVAIGDINNDGLPDLYFTGNQVGNRLYLNNGDFHFTDITDKAGVAGTGAWCTGVSMADVNGDGYLDIYVCYSGEVAGDNKQNELFINNGNMTFLEQAESYGLADRGYSIHAAFFDYDHDNDLDVYLLNNSFKAIGSFDLSMDYRPNEDSLGGDKFYRNDGGMFTDVTKESGIYNSLIGFGLGASVGDLNMDGWQDIYISNDFFEKDYLYLNNGNGTFKEVLENSMGSISAAAMGSDMADINNDGFPDLFVTDMIPEHDQRLKQITMYESWDKFEDKIDKGYYYQYSRNMLQLNNADGTFSEIGRLAGVEATDWSWGALIFDMDNDGNKDIFVANGIYRDITDLDYLVFIADVNTKRSIITKEGVDYKTLVGRMPVRPVPNYAFRNNADLTFSNYAGDWGLGIPSHSNGAAYGDLDNDGDLDLVVNNVNDTAHVFRNQSDLVRPENHFLRFKLKGLGDNTYGLGAKIKIITGQQNYYFEQMPVRGFQSSVDPILIAGIGEADQVDEVVVTWPNGLVSRLMNIKSNQTLTLDEKNAVLPADTLLMSTNKIPVFLEVAGSPLSGIAHTENKSSEFRRDKLIYHKLSTEGPRLAAGDVNGDQRPDVFIGGASGFPAQLFIQNADGSFYKDISDIFNMNKLSEDIGIEMFDADNDQDLDIYVGSGGYEFSYNSSALRDRLYINNGYGQFTISEQPVFLNHKNSTSCVESADYDEDGDIDLFVGSRLQPSGYGVPASGFIYENDGRGKFKDVTNSVAPELADIGMITDADWSDYDNDGDIDLLVVGEWMSVEIFNNSDGILTRVTEKSGIADYKGWWNTIEPTDIDSDGDIDYLIGNHGLNSRFRASFDAPIMLLVNDFDQNGSVDHVFSRKIDEEFVPYALKQNLELQLPYIKKKYPNFSDYYDKTITDIFTADQLDKSVKLIANQLATSIIMNNGNGTFTLKELPVQAQLAPVFAFAVDDFNADGHKDVILGGNFYGSIPEAGRYDASYGLLLLGNSKGDFKAMNTNQSGMQFTGEVRDLTLIIDDSKKLVVVTRNNDNLMVFSY